VSVKFELDNGKLKEYPTLGTEYGTEGYYPDKPYFTKCGLSFKKYPKDGACDHLDCAIYAARDKVLTRTIVCCILPVWMIVLEWIDKGDLLQAFRDWEGFLIMGALLCLLISISPTRRWLELNEYMKQGTIHGRRARRL